MSSICFRSALAFPSNLEELVNLADFLNTYKKDNAGYVTLLFSSAYVFKQTFAIPGSVFLVSMTKHLVQNFTLNNFFTYFPL